MAEHTFLGSNINLIKAHNLQAILLTLLYEKQLSRIQLARKTYLSTTTISNLIADLLDQGVVTEEGTQIQDERRVGRPRTDLRLVPNARFAVGVHIGIGMYRTALVNLNAEKLCTSIEQFPLDTPPEQVLSHIAQTIESIITQSAVKRERIVGIGVGASGLVNFQTGVNLLAPNLGWRNTPIQHHLQTTLNLPVIVDNNVRAMALGEAYFGAGQGIDSLAFVYGRIGVGAGFVVNGQVFRGSNTGAGEIGHTIFLPSGGDNCRCGKRGCLETLVSETVILRDAEAIAQRNPTGLLAKILAAHPEIDPIERVFMAARQGDPETRQLIDEKASYLGIALANLVNVLNPELILLGGMFAQGHDLILPIAAQTMRMMAFASLGEKVRVQPTSFGWSAGVIGASALALMRFFYQQTQPFSGAFPN